MEEKRLRVLSGDAPLRYLRGVAAQRGKQNKEVYGSAFAFAEANQDEFEEFLNNE